MTYSQESSQTLSRHERTSQIEHAIEAVISECDASAIFGTIPERVDYATKVAQLKSEITTNDHIAPLEAGTYIRNLERGVAEQVGVLTKNMISRGEVSEETLSALSALPVPAPAFAPVIKDLYEMAINAHETVVKANSPNERNSRLQAAEPITMVAVTLARDIPEIKSMNKRFVEAQSGETIHAHHLKSVMNDAKANSSKKQAVNSFLEMAHDGQIPDDNPILRRIGITAAAAAVTGLIMSAAPVGAAHADAKIEKIETKASPKEIKPEQTVVLPAAAPGPEKDKPAESTPTAPVKDTKTETPVPTPPTAAVAPKTETPKVSTDKQSPQSNQEAKPVESSAIKMKLPTQPTETPAPAVKDEIKSAPASPSANDEQSKDTKSDAPKEATVPAIENPTGNKSTHEQTTPKEPGTKEASLPHDQQSPSAEPKSDPIKIKLPDANNKPDSEDKAPSTTDDIKPGKDDTATKIIDHLKEGPIKMKLPSANKDEDIEKNTHKDEPKVETIGQPESHPDTKKDLNKEIGKVIMGNGPIKMSLKDVEKKTKERKDEDEQDGDYKPRFKFAPSAELPPEPKIIAETYRGAPIPEHIIDPSLAGETQWSPETLTYIRDHLEMYTNIEKQTGVAWEIMAALHVREASMAMANPVNGQGIFQLFSTGEHFSPGPITKEEFTRQGILAANFFKQKARDNSRVGGPLDLSNPDKVKDTLFAYNGVANGYIAQAHRLGYTLGAEGSPYVMNLADDRRNNLKDSNWKQVLTDGGELRNANQAPGAWVLIDGLIRIEQKAHDQAVAKQQAEAQEFEAKKASERKAAEDAEKAKNKLGVFDGWHDPLGGKAPVSSKFGPRGPGVMHTGEDYGVKTGTPFLAAAGGVAKVFTYDVSNAAFCKSALAGLGVSMDAIKDPIQKEVQVTSVVDGVTYVTVYAHMSKIDVKDGELVAGGQKLGETGGSGCSTAEHAHFEIRKNGTTPIDPETILGGAIKASSSEIKVIDDAHDHIDHEQDAASTTASIAAPVTEAKNTGETVTEKQTGNDGLLKIDHSNETAKIPDVQPANNNSSVEQAVSEAIAKARRAAEISNAALETARNNDKVLVK